MTRTLLILTLLFSFQAYGVTTLEKADQIYAQRDFNPTGVKKAQEAAALYETALTEVSSDLGRNDINLKLASARYFLGTAMSDKNERKKQHQMAMDIADQIMNDLGVDSEKAPELSQAEVTEVLNKLDDQRELQLAEAMYAKGINLAQWGQLNGITSSIGKLPVVLGLMERIEMLGYQKINEYGPYRTIGRIRFSLPGILGGDLEESEQRLKEAYRNTLVQGQRYSENGYNNIYLAETLHKRGKETQAVKILEQFINADFATLTEGKEPENREALRTAKDLYDGWK